MSLLQNGDFSNGLEGWRVSEPVGRSAPTFDPDEERVIFGNASNDVNNGDTLEQDVALTEGEEYTLTFTMAEVGDSPFAGFGLTIDLIRVLPDGTQTSDTQSLGSFQTFNNQTNEFTVTFTSDFDDAIFRIRGQFGFGTTASDLVLDDFTLTCFAEGTMIDTPHGPVAIEDLAVGDLVNTADNGPCAIKWVGSRHVTAQELARKPAWQPVLIPAGSIAENAPSRDLVVSPAHRVLLSNTKMDMVLGMPEALAPANALIGAIDGVKKLTDLQPVTYYHLLFDQHEVISSNGLLTESFHPASETVSHFEKDAKSEVLSLFPQLRESEGAAVPLARPAIKAFEVRASMM